MKTYKYYVFFLLAFSVSQNNEGYVFKHTLEDSYYDVETIVENHFGPWTVLVNFSARHTRSLVGIDEKTGEITTIQAWENVIASTRVDDKIEPNHGVHKMNEASYIELWDSGGNNISKTPRDDISREIAEEQQNNSMGAMFSTDNILYVLGGDTVRFEGDVWVHEEEKEINQFVGLDFFEGTKKEASTFTFKKVKIKKGDTIAYITQFTQIELHGVGSTWEKTIEFTQILSGECNIQFNVDRGLIKKSKMSLSSIGEGRDLEDDTIRKHIVNMMIESKGRLR